MHREHGPRGQYRPPRGPRSTARPGAKASKMAPHGPHRRAEGSERGGRTAPGCRIRDRDDGRDDAAAHRRGVPAGATRPIRRGRCASRFPVAETSFDPQFASDAASDGIIANVYEAMLDYDYLARPVRLVPRTLEAMPVVQDGGATYVFKLKQGHPVHARPGVQGQAARAHRGRSRLRHQAAARSGREEPVAVAGRGQDPRRRRSTGPGGQGRQVRLRRADRRPGGRRPLHAEDSPEGA